jgi:hypothetical protein
MLGWLGSFSKPAASGSARTPLEKLKGYYELSKVRKNGVL